MWCRNPAPYGRWIRRSVTVGVGTMALLLVARGAWADCNTLWTTLAPDCLVRKAGGMAASGIAGKIAEGVSWLAKQIGDGARTAGRPDMDKHWFIKTVLNSRDLAVLFAIVGMLLSIIYAALKRDVHEIGRTLTRVLAAGLTTGGITVVVATANGLVDDLCEYVLGPRGWAVVTDTFRGPIRQLGQVSGYADPSSPGQTTPPVIAIMIGAVLLITFAVIWAELLLRRVAIDICVLFWPLAVSGAVWANARLWTRKLIDSLTSLVLSKLVIVLILKFASRALTNINGVSDLLLAAGVFAAAAFAPYWVMKMIGFIGGAIQPGHTGEGMRAAATGAVTGAAMTVTRIGLTAATGGGAAAATAVAGTALGRGGRGPGGGSGGGGMRGGGRTPMPPAGGGTRDGQGQRGFTAGGHAANGAGARPTSAGRGNAGAGSAPGTRTQGGTAGVSTGSADGQETARTRQVPEPPPAPRPYPAVPVPPHLRPAASGGDESGGAAGTGSPAQTPTSAEPGAQPAPPRPPVRRPAPWPGPRRDDPSAPMYRPSSAQPPPKRD